MKQLLCICTADLTKDGVGGVQSHITDEHATSGSEHHAGRRGIFALAIGDDFCKAVPPNGHTRVRRTEVDADRQPAGHRGCHLHSQLTVPQGPQL